MSILGHICLLKKTKQNKSFTNLLLSWRTSVLPPYQVTSVTFFPIPSLSSRTPQLYSPHLPSQTAGQHHLHLLSSFAQSLHRASAYWDLSSLTTTTATKFSLRVNVIKPNEQLSALILASKQQHCWWLLPFPEFLVSHAQSFQNHVEKEHTNSEARLPKFKSVLPYTGCVMVCKPLNLSETPKFSICKIRDNSSTSWEG